MRIDWVVGGNGAGGKDVDDAEAAHSALCDAIRQTYGHVDTNALVELLGPIYGLRLAMVTDGQMAVERGNEWSAVVGSVLVRLSP